MKVLLDTNIVIHREASRAIRTDIGPLFMWLDRLHHTKCVQQASIDEINKLPSGEYRDALNVKLSSYEILRTQPTIHPDVAAVASKYDQTKNDAIDTQLINDVFLGRVDLLISEDKKVHRKAKDLGIADRVLTIEGFLEQVTAEHPELVDYKVLAVKKELFGNIDLADPFFDSFREDYPGFDRWFNRKSEDTAYVCTTDTNIAAFLYVKPEGPNEPYPDIWPQFVSRRRLKIGTFKVFLNGLRLGERFLKIVFDNAIRYRAEEVYVTIFDKRPEQQVLMNLLEDFGFKRFGIKKSSAGDEHVLVRSMLPTFDRSHPAFSYPYISRSARTFFCPIRQEYHTSLLPDSILRTESPLDFVENEPFRNAIRKVYVSRSLYRSLESGDVIVFYRNGGLYKGVATTLGIVENTIHDIRTAEQLIAACRKRSVLTDKELVDFWNYRSPSRPFVVNFLYTYSFPKRPNLAKLIQLGVVKSLDTVPRGFERLSAAQFDAILRETQTDGRYIVD